MAIAVQASPKTDLGVVAFYRLDAQGNAAFMKKVSVGSLPDGMAFSPDGSKLVVANEGELSVNFATDGIDPVGSISIIAVANGVPADTATPSIFLPSTQVLVVPASCLPMCALAALAQQ
jgi:DNA-binding beta-propeller fold protein YncE